MKNHLKIHVISYCAQLLLINKDHIKLFINSASFIFAIFLSLVLNQANAGFLDVLFQPSLESQVDKHLIERDFLSASRLVNEALTKAKQSDSDYPFLITKLGIVYEFEGRLAEAEAMLRKAVQFRRNEKPINAGLLERALSHLGVTLLMERKYEEASSVMNEQLLIIKNNGGESRFDGNDPRMHQRADFYHNFGVALLDAGRAQDALGAHQKELNLRVQKFGVNAISQVFALGSMVNCYLALHDYSNAQQYLHKTLELWKAGNKSDPNWMPDDETFPVEWQSNEAFLNYQNGNYNEAYALISRVIRAARSHVLDKTKVEDSAIDYKGNVYMGAFATYLSISANAASKNMKLLDEVAQTSFEVAQLYHDASVGRALSKMAIRQSTGDEKLAVLLRDQQDALNKLKQLEREIGNGDNSTGTKIGALRSKIAEIDKTIAENFPAYSATTGIQPVSLKSVQSLLGADEALLMFLSEEDGDVNLRGAPSTFVWVISSKEASFRKVAISRKDLTKRIEILRDALVPSDRRPIPKPYPVEEAFHLYDALIKPDEAILAKIRNLIVVGDGPLESIPFSVLVTSAPKIARDKIDYQKISWLSRRWATTTLPTVSSLSMLRMISRDRTLPQLPFIGFANPNFGTSSTGDIKLGVSMAQSRGALADPEMLHKARPLPETEDELKAIANLLGADASSVVSGDRASVPNVMAANLADYRVVAFATHALIADDMKALQIDTRAAEPAILLTVPAQATQDNDGLLRASQVASLKLNADWVILSACNTAAPDGNPGAPGLSGLAKSFFYAGARTLLVSHWPVVSSTTVQLTTGLFTEEKSHPEISHAEALRRSMMNLLDHPIHPIETHPQFWAPFVVAGESKESRTQLGH